ncbi:MAG TPA: lysophospholipid acyltransferase family protein [Syntrophales bacterium]|nr:lysophospholipid acyltransferase family protein [Syntrophales bacterium]HOL58446.1 lysophospholipid acyltransferase family protein [Syntrophales bacterium]HPO34615.1 lysophospholipid acyltransferase family protein [Syntrophales bacterium]
MIQIVVQEWLARVTSFWVVFSYFLFLKLRGYRVRNLKLIRKRWRALLKEHPGPWLVCPNHLTMIDSFIVTYGLFSFFDHFRFYLQVPWNLPEKVNFYKNFFYSCALYLAKCIPIRRGGSREEVLGTLAKCHFLLKKGRALLIFPEGGRSRTGRVNRENCTYGVGRLLEEHPDCRVLCVYLRGDAQDNYSYFPADGDTFTMMIKPLVPVRKGLHGLRAQRDYARQVIETLARMEEVYFAVYRKRRRGFEHDGESGQERRSALHQSGIYVG